MYLVAAVVVAALLPLALPALGVPVGPGVVSAEAADPAEPKRAVTAPRPDDANASADSTVAVPSPPASPLQPDTAVAWVESPPVDEPIIIEDVDDEAEDERAEPSPNRADARSRRTRSAPMARAKAACRKGDKEAARTAYRLIPFGDERRREIRRACRRQGIWIL